MNFPTKTSVELGLKLVAIDIVSANQSLVESCMDEAQAVHQSFHSIEKFGMLVHGIHSEMCHGPMAESCQLQTQLLYAIMAKMFYAGWSAGRQEIIDAEVARINTDADHS